MGKDIHKHEFKIGGGRKVASTNKKIAKSINTIARASRRLSSGFARTGSLMGTQALGLITVGLAMRKVIRSYGDYDNSLARIRTTLSSTNETLGTTAVKASGLSEVMSRRLAYSVTESNNAMNTLLQTGIGTQRSMRIFETGLQLARVAEMDTGDAMQFMVDSMNAFNKEMADGDESLRGFSRRMVSQLSVAANSAATSMGQLQNAFRYAGGEMAGFGYGSQETIAALASMSVGGIRGSSAGTRLRGAIAALHSVTPRTERVFKQFGITADELSQTFYDAEGRRRPLQQGMQRMGAIFGRVRTEVGKNQALLRLYGRRALIAGMSLSDMSKIAKKFHEIMGKFQGEDGFGQLAEDIRTGAVIDRQAEQRMQSFGIQVEQTKHAVEELAIGFGEILFAGLKKGNEGFGTYLRNLAGNMRLARLGTRRTGEQAAEWNRLSQAEKDSATELKDFLESTVGAIKIISKAVIWVGKFVSENRELLPVLAGIALTFHPMTLGIIKFGLSFTTAATAATAGGAAIGGAAALAGVGILALIGISGFLSVKLRENMIRASGVEKEFDEVKDTTLGMVAQFVESIPIIGGVISQFVFLAAAVEHYLGVKKTLDASRETSRRREMASVSTILQQEEEKRRAAGQTFTDEERGSFARQERSRSVGRLSAAFSGTYQRSVSRYGDIEGREAMRGVVRGRLERSGIQGRQLERMTSQILLNLSSDLDTYRQEAERLDYTQDNMSGNVRILTTQIKELNTEITNVANTIAGTEFGFGSSPIPVDYGPQSVPSVQDGYIRRGGMVGVSSGDIVVSRSHLADAVGGPRGSMVPALTGQSQSTVQPPGGSGGGTTSVQADVPIILQLDGAEIARAVGKVHLRHIERSGTTIQPGQRRTLAESGFSESRR